TAAVLLPRPRPAPFPSPLLSPALLRAPASPLFPYTTLLPRAAPSFTINNTDCHAQSSSLGRYRDTAAGHSADRHQSAAGDYRRRPGAAGTGRRAVARAISAGAVGCAANRHVCTGFGDRAGADCPLWRGAHNGRRTGLADGRHGAALLARRGGKPVAGHSVARRGHRRG